MAFAMDNSLACCMITVAVLLYNSITILLQLVFDSYIFSSYRQLVFFDLLFCVVSLFALITIYKKSNERSYILYVVLVQFLFVLIEVTVFLKEQLIFKLVYIYWLKFGLLCVLPFVVFLIVRV